MKIFILFLSLFVSSICSAQYIGVKARYTETRLVDDSPNPPRRENRLVLSFFEVAPSGVYTPIAVSNYDIYLYNGGLQYGSSIGGVLDSMGNNYDGYAWTAPKVVSYNNSLGLNYHDCVPDVMTHFVANGHELDCGYVLVSYWDIDYGTGLAIEMFPAPNIALPFYEWPDPFSNPGQVNFGWPIPPGPPYNWYSTNCGNGMTSFVVRGVLPADTGNNVVVVLPVRFANVGGTIDAGEQVNISWTNLTESAVASYAIESSVDGISFHHIGTVLPVKNNGDKADYTFSGNQTIPKVYYRIKAVETNGSFLYSNIFSLQRNGQITTLAESLSVYPNPVTGNVFSFRLTDAAPGRYIACIITAAGQQLKHKLIEQTSGDLIRTIDMNGLPKGIYRLLLRSEGKKFIQTFMYAN